MLESSFFRSIFIKNACKTNPSIQFTSATLKYLVLHFRKISSVYVTTVIGFLLEGYRNTETRITPSRVSKLLLKQFLRTSRLFKITKSINVVMSEKQTLLLTNGPETFYNTKSGPSLCFSKIRTIFFFENVPKLLIHKI